MKSTRSRTIFT